MSYTRTAARPLAYRLGLVRVQYMELADHVLRMREVLCR